MKVIEESEKIGLKLNIQKTKIMASGPITSWQTDGETVREWFWRGLQKSLQMVTTAMKLKDAYSLEKKTNRDSILKSRDITLPTKVHLVKALVSPVVMYGCESWTIKKAERWRIGVFELWRWRRLLTSPLDCKESKPVHPKGNQSWAFTGRTDAEAETPILWPPDVKNWLTGKDPDAGKDWRQEK